MTAHVLGAGLSDALAQPALPAVSLVDGTEISPSSAWSYYSSSGGTVSPAAPDRDARVKDLARALQYDIDLIYDHVHDTVKITPMFGLQNGAVGAILNSAGTSFDQANLMVELLREADEATAADPQLPDTSYAPVYVYGTIQLDASEVYAWLGIDDADAARDLFADGGIPATVTGSGAAFNATIAHVWVRATVGGQTYHFDPSYKSHTHIAGMDIAAITGLTQAGLIAAGAQGATITSGNATTAASISGFNAAAVENALRNAAIALFNHIRATKPEARLEDVIGGSIIDEHDGSPVRQPSHPLAAGAPLATWSDHIPNVFRTKVTLACTGVSVDRFLDETYGAALGGAGCGANTSSLSITVDHPYAASSGDYADQTIVRSFPATSLGGPAIIAAVGPYGPSHIEELYERFASENMDFPEMPYSVTVHSWLLQNTLRVAVQERAAGARVNVHHTVGIWHNDGGWDPDDFGVAGKAYYIDADAALSVTRIEPSAPTEADVAREASVSFAAAEAATFAETRRLSRPVWAGSLFGYSSREGANTFYKFDNINQVNSTSGELLANGYDAAAFGHIQAYVAAGYSVVAPAEAAWDQREGAPSASALMHPDCGGVESAVPPLCGWLLNPTNYPYDPRVPYASFWATNETDFAPIMVAMATSTSPGSGPMKGGGGSIVDPTEITPDEIYSLSLTFLGDRHGMSADLASGSVRLTPPPDLVVGNPSDHPLVFQRYYTGANSTRAVSGLPGGWTHNFAGAAAPGTSPATGLGRSYGSDAAAAIVAFHAGRLLAVDAGMASQLGLFIAHQWLIEEFQDNTLTIDLPGQDGVQFVRSPSRDYVAPISHPGHEVTADLQIEYGCITWGFTTQLGGEGVGWATQATSYLGSVTYETPDGMRYEFVGINDPGIERATWCGTPWGGEHRNGVSRFSLTGITHPDGYAVEIWVNPGGMPAFVKDNLGRSMELIHRWIDPGQEFLGLGCMPSEPTSTDPYFYTPYGSSRDRFCILDNVTSEDAGTAYYLSLDSSAPNGVAFGLLSASGPGGGGSYSYGHAVSFAGKHRLTHVSSPGLDLDIAYDSTGRVTTLTNALGQSSRIHASGRRGAFVDPLGNTLALHYDRFGNLTRAVDPVGRVTTAAYDSFDRVTTITRPEGNSVAYEYDDGHVTDVYSGGTLTQRRVWHNITAVTLRDKQGGDPLTSSYNYADANWPRQVTRAVDARGAVTDFTYDAQSGFLLTRTDPPDLEDVRPVWTNVLASYPGKFVDTLPSPPGGSIRRFVKNIDPEGRETRFQYYPVLGMGGDAGCQSANGDHGELCSSIVEMAPAADIVTKYEYDANGNAIRVTDPRGYATDSYYDARRRLVLTLEPDPDGGGAAVRPATITRFNGDDLVNFTATRSQDESLTKWEVVVNEYDAVGRLVRTARPVQATLGTVASAGDVANLPLRAIGAGDQISVTAYDAAGRPTHAADETGRATLTEYFPDGQPFRVSDGYAYTPSGAVDPGDFAATPLTRAYRRSLYGPGAAGDPMAGLLAAMAGRNGQIVSLTSARGHATAYAYDAHDRLLATTFPDGSTVENTQYDANGNVLETRTRGDDDIRFDYDDLNRLVRKVVPETAVGAGDGRDELYGYDLSGLMTCAAVHAPGATAPGDRCEAKPNFRHRVVQAYDPAGRLTSETAQAAGGPSRTVGYQYDQNGNRTRITWPDGYYVTYVYDPLNRLIYVRENGSVVLARTLWRAYDGRLDLTLRGGASWSDGSAEARVVYAWEADGDLDKRTLRYRGTGEANHVFDYGYDASGRLVSETRPAGWAWGAVGAEDVAYSLGAGSTATSKLDQYASVGGAAVSYDPNGNRAAYAGLMTHHDAESRLVHATAPGMAVAYLYDAMGRRVGKDFTTGGFADKTILWAGDMEIAEYDAAGKLLARYVPGGAVDDRVAMIVCGAGAGTCPSPAASWFIPDRLGHVVAMIDAAGGLAEQYRYSPFGVEGTPFDPGGNPFRYTGRYYDAETGLYHYRARYYDPGLGRFLQTDPIGYQDQMNLYAYVYNDPINGWDPSGTDGCRLVNPDSAWGNGHSGFCVTDESGNLEAGEYGMYDPKDTNGDGSNAVYREIPNMPANVPTDGEGNVTFRGMEQIVGAFGDNENIDAVYVSHFPEGDNLDGARSVIADVQSEIASGEDYNLFTCNCDDIASRVLVGAGVGDIGHGIRPNSVSGQERTGAEVGGVSNRLATGRWTGTWIRQPNGRWGYAPGR